MILTGANTLMDLPEGRYDGHAHVFRVDLPMAEGRRYTPKNDALPETLCQFLYEYQLDGSLLVQPSFLGSDNGYLLKTLTRYAGHGRLKFKGVVVLDPLTKPDPGRLRAMGDLGVIGVRLNLLRQADAFRYSDWRPLLTETERLGWHVELHCEAKHLNPILPALVRRHGRVVVDHFGLVTDARRCSGLKTILSQPREQMWIKASAAYRIATKSFSEVPHDHIEHLRDLYVDRLGPDRVVWGSDWPFTQFEEVTTYADAIMLAS